jgi:hypothetical protein
MEPQSANGQQRADTLSQSGGHPCAPWFSVSLVNVHPTYFSSISVPVPIPGSLFLSSSQKDSILLPTPLLLSSISLKSVPKASQRIPFPSPFLQDHRATPPFCPTQKPMSYCGGANRRMRISVNLRHLQAWKRKYLLSTNDRVTGTPYASWKGCQISDRRQGP